MAVTEEQIYKYRKPSYVDVFNTTQAVTDDALDKVPPGKTKSMWTILFSWIGFMIFPGGIMTGAAIGLSMGTKTAVMAILIGNAILAAVASASGWIGHKTRLTLPLIFKYCWGRQGFFFATILFWLPYTLWVGVESGMLAGFVDESITIGWHSTIGLWFALAAVIPAALGLKWVARVAKVGVPLLLSLIIAGVVISSRLPAPGPAVVTMSISTAIGLVVGTFIAGALANADFARYLKTPKQVFTVSVLTFMVGQSLFMLAGMYIGQRVGQAWGLGSMFAYLGLLIPGILIIGVSLFTTMDANSYSGGLQLTSVFGRWGVKRWQAVMIHGAVAGIVATTGIYYSYLGFLLTLSAIVPAIGGVLFGDAISNWKSKYLGIERWWHVGGNSNWIAIVSFIAGASLNAVLFLNTDMSYGGVFGLLLAMGVYYGIRKLGRPDPLVQTYERDRHIIEEVEKATSGS